MPLGEEATLDVAMDMAELALAYDEGARKEFDSTDDKRKREAVKYVRTNRKQCMHTHVCSTKYMKLCNKIPAPSDSIFTCIYSCIRTCLQVYRAAKRYQEAGEMLQKLVAQKPDEEKRNQLPDEIFQDDLLTSKGGELQERAEDLVIWIESIFPDAERLSGMESTEMRGKLET
jgi:hypothetical protein